MPLCDGCGGMNFYSTSGFISLCLTTIYLLIMRLAQVNKPIGHLLFLRLCPKISKGFIKLEKGSKMTQFLLICSKVLEFWGLSHIPLNLGS